MKAGRSREAQGTPDAMRYYPLTDERLPLFDACTHEKLGGYQLS
jgi:hypothetical protein